MRAGVPNTGGLLNPATGEIKSLEAVLMADGWDTNPAAAAAAAVRMEDFGIVPLLPRGDSRDVGDSCHVWPPQPSDRQLARSYYQAKAKAKAEGAEPAAATASDEVSAGSPADGGAGRWCTTLGAVGRSISVSAVSLGLIVPTRTCVLSWPRRTVFSTLCFPPCRPAVMRLHRGAAPGSCRPPRAPQPQQATWLRRTPLL